MICVWLGDLALHAASENAIISINLFFRSAYPKSVPRGVGHTALPIPELISRNEQNVYTFLPSFATMIILNNSLINMLKVPKASIEKTINIGPKE